MGNKLDLAMATKVGCCGNEGLFSPSVTYDDMKSTVLLCATHEGAMISHKNYTRLRDASSNVPLVARELWRLVFRNINMIHFIGTLILL